MEAQQGDVRREDEPVVGETRWTAGPRSHARHAPPTSPYHIDLGVEPQDLLHAKKKNEAASAEHRDFDLHHCYTTGGATPRNGVQAKAEKPAYISWFRNLVQCPATA